ncbi:GH3 auxin-responsive promoter family protein [soil metagenome]
MKKRVHDIELFKKYPINVQQEVIFKLINTAKNTEFGKKYHFNSIKTIADFKERVPTATYETIFPYIDRLMKGEQNLLWPTEIEWFAKSSGTTNARSKFIPVSKAALDDCHYKGGKDMISLYVNNHPDTKLFTGKGLAIGGSHQSNTLNKKANTFYGDISAVIMKNLPLWAQYARTPSLEIALMDEWEAKIEKMAQATSNENVTSISGVPTWTLILLQRILEIKQKKNILEVWPNLEVFVHGAVSFTPYRSLFQNLIPSSSMRYVETYNASEGFFGIQDQPGINEMLLMLDYGIFYEFIPFEEIENPHPHVVSLEDVQVGKNYAMVISTNAGLWRYQIGDTVRFTSVDPFRVKVSGRTKHYINAFGEELIVENAETAISRACEETNATIDNFTAAPKYMEALNKGGHEWIIEFTKAPDSLEKFKIVLDEALREVNSDYDAKRYKDIALEAPTIHIVPEGTFYNWMKKRGKLGGQHKVPRLANDRIFVEDILEMLEIKK